MVSEPVASHARGILRSLHARSGQIEASAWVSLDGFVLASVLGADANADRIGAMCASLIALSRRATQEIDVGELRQIILDGSTGIMLLTQSGRQTALTLSASKSAALGRVLIEAKAAATELSQLEGS